MNAADLSSPEHENTAAIEAIEYCFADYGLIERPIVPALKRRFPLTTREAVVVIRETTLRRARAA